MFQWYGWYFQNTEQYNPNKKTQNIDCFWWYDCFMLSNNKLNLIVTELFIRDINLTTSLVFVTQPYFSVLKNIRLTSTPFFMKIPKKRELQQTASNHSSAIDFEDFMNLYKKCTANPCSIVIDTTLASDNPSRFNLLERIWQLIISLEMKNCNIILTEN